MTDNQFDQLFGIMTKTVSSIQELSEKVDSVELKVDGLRQEFDTFREETGQNFSEVKKELRQTNRKIDILHQDVIDVRINSRDLEERIEVLEEKKAA